jgi:hypothetical protein
MFSGRDLVTEPSIDRVRKPSTAYSARAAVGSLIRVVIRRTESTRFDDCHISKSAAPRESACHFLPSPYSLTKFEFPRNTSIAWITVRSTTSRAEGMSSTKSKPSPASCRRLVTSSIGIF